MMELDREVKRIMPGRIKVELPKSIAGMARSRRMIMIGRQMEVQFMICCREIQLETLRKQRSERQRDERREKRRRVNPGGHTGDIMCTC